MNFRLTDEQKMIQEMARNFGEKESKPRAAEIDAPQIYPLPVLTAMTDLEFMGGNILADNGAFRTGVVNCRHTYPGMKLLEVSPRKDGGKKKNLDPLKRRFHRHPECGKGLRRSPENELIHLCFSIFVGEGEREVDSLLSV